MEDDRSYYARRAEAETRNANSASDDETRRLHVELAEMLRGKARLNAPRRSATLLK